MRYRIDLESGREVSTSTLQELREAAPTGNGKTGVVFLNIDRNASSSVATFDVLTASSPARPDLVASSFWGSVGSTSISAGQTGLIRFEIGVTAATRLGEVIRWKMGGTPGLNGAVHFSAVVYLWDT